MVLRIIDKAEEHLAACKRGRQVLGRAHVRSPDPELRRKRAALLLPVIRGELAGGGESDAAERVILHFDDSSEILERLAAERCEDTTSVRVLGTGDLLSRLARCCNPVPGDEIIGYVTRGEGVTIHRNDCRNVINEDERERLVDVEWGQRGHLYPVAVRIEAWDRVGLLRDLSTMVAEERVNMVGFHTQEQEDGLITIFVTLETTGIEQLTRLLNRLEAVRGVLAVGRRLEGTPK